MKPKSKLVTKAELKKYEKMDDKKDDKMMTKKVKGHEKKMHKDKK